MQAKNPRSTVFSAKELRTFFVCLAVSAICIWITFFSGLRRIPEQTVWKGNPLFEAKKAYEWTHKLAKNFPNRVPWKPEHQAAAQFLINELKKLGYKEPEIITFDETIGTRDVKGLQNIFVTLKGTKIQNEIIVVHAHYDVTDTTIEGAADDASGVGTVLELARIFKQKPTSNRTLIFLLTDSEEYGALWGAHEFIKQYPHTKNIVAAISLDFLAPEEQEEIMVLTDGLKSGYTPLWLRELALNSIRAVPFKANDTRNLLEYVQRALLIPPAEHGAFLMAGIPALNYFGKSKDFKKQMGSIHHTPLDIVENLQIKSFESYGKSTEILIHSLDAYPSTLNKPNFKTGDYWKLTDYVYLAEPFISIMHGLFCVPFLVYMLLLCKALKQYPRKLVFQVMKNEVKGFSVLFLSLLAGYGVLRILPDLKFIEKYEMFPATQKSLILYNPQYLVIGFLFLLTVTLYFLLSYILKSRLDKQNPDYISQIRIRHSLLGIILGLIIVLAFLKNEHLGTLLVLPPAYLWMFMKNSRTIDSKLLNILLFIGGLLSLIAVCVITSFVFHIGVLYWYLLLAAAYGLVSVYAAVLAFALIAVAIRILRNLYF